MNRRIVKEAEARLFEFARSLSEQLPQMLPFEQPPQSADEAFDRWWRAHHRTLEFVNQQARKWAHDKGTDELPRDAALMLLLRASSSVLVLREILAGKGHAGGELAEQSESAADVIELVMVQFWSGEVFVRDELRALAERQFSRPQ